MEKIKDEQMRFKKAVKNLFIIGMVGLAAYHQTAVVLSGIKESGADFKLDLGLTSVGITNFGHEYAGNSDPQDKHFFVLPTDFFDGTHYKNGHVVENTQIKVQNFFGQDFWTEQDEPNY